MTDPIADGTRGSTAGVRQLRVVVTADDFDQALAFYRDVLGLTERAAFEDDGDARVAILDAGHATLELANPAQAAMIDRMEAGQRVSPHIRLAFEVDDARATTTRLSAAGAEVIGEPAVTPWNSLNSRLQGPAGIQLTLFEELGTTPVRHSLESLKYSPCTCVFRGKADGRDGRRGWPRRRLRIPKGD